MPLTRYVIAGALLYPIARRASAATRATARGGARPGAKAWLACAVVGLLLLFAGNGGVSVAETRLPSGVAALLVATVPLWMIVFAWPVEHQRVTTRAAAGLAIGLAGVAVLVGAGLSGGGMSGVFIVLGASAAWGLGSVLSHRLPVPGGARLGRHHPEPAAPPVCGLGGCGSAAERGRHAPGLTAGRAKPFAPIPPGGGTAEVRSRARCGGGPLRRVQ